MTLTSDVGQQCLGKYCCLAGIDHEYFVGIRSLFSFILRTYTFVIMLCIDMGYTRHCVDGSFLFCYHQKSEEGNYGCITVTNARTCKF